MIIIYGGIQPMADYDTLVRERYAHLTREAQAAQPHPLTPQRLADLQRHAQQWATNEVAKAQHQQERATRQANERAAMQARNDARITEYRNQCRLQWVGDDASFESAWPELLQRWQMAQLRNPLDAKRAMGDYSQF